MNLLMFIVGVAICLSQIVRTTPYLPALYVGIGLALTGFILSREWMKG